MKLLRLEIENINSIYGPQAIDFVADLKEAPLFLICGPTGAGKSTVLDAISRLAELGVWTEVVTVVIPTVNDSDAELRGIARFLASVSKDLPWHVAAFHKDYRMTGPADTPAETLERAARIGRSEGLRYVYAGRFPGKDGDFEDTRCLRCRALLVERFGDTGALMLDCGLGVPDEAKPENLYALREAAEEYGVL